MAERSVGAALLVPGVLAVLALSSACRPHSRPPLHGGPIVLVTFDSLRADTVTGLGGPAELTPHLAELIRGASWAGKGIAASSWEVPAMASLWTGLRPWQHQSLDAGHAHLADDLLTLPEALKTAGYTTAGFTSGRWYSGPLGYDQGFDSLVDFGRGREAMERLKTLPDGRQFVWIHIPDARAPYLRRDWLVPRLGPGMAEYLAPLPHRVELADLEPFFDAPLPLGRRRWFFSMYRLNAAWADERFGRLLQALKASGRYGDTLLVVTANHGEEFGEHDQILHGGNLGRSLVEVPLIVKLPAGWKRPLAENPARPVAASRLWATLLEAVGGTPPPAVAPSLFRHDATGTVSELYHASGINQLSLVEDGYQLLWTSRYAPSAPGAAAGPDRFASTPPLSGAAPVLKLERWEERANTPVADPAREERMARRLRELWQRFLPGESSPADEEREWSPAALDGWRKREGLPPAWRKGMAQR